MASSGFNVKLSPINNPDVTQFKHEATNKLCNLTKNYVFKQKYIRGAQIDAGGTCKIYEVKHKNYNRDLIMKVVSLESKHVLEEVQNLMWLQRRCSGNNRLHSSFYMLPYDPDVYYQIHNDKYQIKIIFPRMTGNLYQLFKSKPSFNHGEYTEPIRYVLNAVVPALFQLHEELKMIHRDLKPENLLFSRKDGEIKICDFGLSTQNSESIFKTKCGTNNYKSPEVYFEQEYDFASESFSLGRTVQSFVDIREEDRQRMYFWQIPEEDDEEKRRWYHMIGSLEVSLLCDGLVDGKLYLLKCDGFKYSSYSKKSVTQLFQRPIRFPHYKSIGELMICSLHGNPKARPSMNDWRKSLNRYRDTDKVLRRSFRNFIEWRENN